MTGLPRYIPEYYLNHHVEYPGTLEYTAIYYVPHYLFNTME